MAPERQGEIIPLKDRIDSYLPPLELLYEYPKPGFIEREIKQNFEEQRPGAKYVLVYSPLLGKLVITPPWHPLNMAPMETPDRDYAQVVFDGGSVEPVFDKKGNIVAGSIILYNAKKERLMKSIRAHGFDKKIDFSAFDQGMKDLISIHGKDILVSPDGVASRGYIRPFVGRGGYTLGVKPPSWQEPNLAVSVSNMKHYLDADAYKKGEKVVLFVDQQRITPIVAKEARNYGNGSVLAERARQFGAGEIIFFGPYTVDQETRGIKEYINNVQGEIAVQKLLESGVLADGMGEEILGIMGDTIVIPPADVFKLNGTTLEYIVSKMAPAMGLNVRELRFTVKDIREGIIDALLFAGNAVKVCPIAEIKVCDVSGVIEVLKLNAENPVSKRIVKRFSQELSGEILSSHPSLHTRIEFSPEARVKLDKAYSDWV